MTTRPRRNWNKRNALLAKVHVAKKQLCIEDEDYRDILMREFGVESSRDLEESELISLVEYFESKGFQSHPVSSKDYTMTGALRHRALDLRIELDLNDKRWRGLLRKFCGVEHIEWCRDVGSLKRLIAVLERIDK